MVVGKGSQVEGKGCADSWWGGEFKELQDILVPCGEQVGEGKGRDVRGQLEECWGSIRVDLMLSKEGKRDSDTERDRVRKKKREKG